MKSLITAAISGNIGAAPLSGIGKGTVTDCAVDIGILELKHSDTAATARAYVGGISPEVTSTERCRVRFGTMKVCVSGLHILL